jgi:predicted DCC family thiol-disulfide oxidoreductase YuxK
MSSKNKTMTQQLILFDGVCNLCNQSVDFIIKRDKKDVFLFTSLQSAQGQEILKQHSLNTQDFDSVLLLKNGKLYQKSTAALLIGSQLGGFWVLSSVFMLIPPFIRNIVYDWIARNRYRWHGKKETCRLPTPEERKKFL